MMGQQEEQKDLFTYNIDLDRRVRTDNPLRQIAATIDFSFIRHEVAHTYGRNGNVSVDPAVILKMMFLLFYDNVSSERELMKIIPERLDYLWFLGYGLDTDLPDHSVLSKARARWGTSAFEKFFVRTVAECVHRGLVNGSKIHMDGSLIRAAASTDAVIEGSPELLAALRTTYREQEAKLEEIERSTGPVNQTHFNQTDPDAQLARTRSMPSRPAYKVHRAVDDAHGVITAQTITVASVKEDTQLTELIDQHQHNTATQAQITVADSQYGTVQNFLICQERGITPHMADLKSAQERAGKGKEFFGEDKFTYQAKSDTYVCPAGQTMRRWQKRAEKGAWQYMAGAKVCAGCSLRTQCTAAKGGRRIQRFERQEQIDQARQKAESPAAIKDRKRRRHIMEGSFADAANNHGFKRSRWRRLWRQKIQNHLIAACQNIRILSRRDWKSAGEAVPACFLSATLSNCRHLMTIAAKMLSRSTVYYFLN